MGVKVKVALSVVSLAAMFLVGTVDVSGGEANKIEPAYLADLQAHLSKTSVNDDAIQLIIHHLQQTNPPDPLTELVGWAAANFPDLHDENGYWKVLPDLVELGIVRPVHFFLLSVPEAERAKRYFAVVDTLCRGDGTDYYTWQLAGSASFSVSPALLKKEALKRMASQKEGERCQGVLMAVSLAEDPEVLAMYRNLLARDSSRNVKVTILYSTGSLRKRDAALLSLDRLLNDPLKEVRELAARCLKVANQIRTGLTPDDLHLILFPMIETQDPQVRVTLGQVAARITTEMSLMVDDQKLIDDALVGFTDQARSKGLRADDQQNRKEIFRLWTDWWGMRRAAYTKPQPPPVE